MQFLGTPVRAVIYVHILFLFLFLFLFLLKNRAHCLVLYKFFAQDTSFDCYDMGEEKEKSQQFVSDSLTWQPYTESGTLPDKQKNGIQMNSCLLMVGN